MLLSCVVVVDALLLVMFALSRLHCVNAATLNNYLLLLLRWGSALLLFYGFVDNYIPCLLRARKHLRMYTEQTKGSPEIS